MAEPLPAPRPDPQPQPQDALAAAAPARWPGAMLPGGSEWTFEQLERYDHEIARVARHCGLDTYPNQIEIIRAEQMMMPMPPTACRWGTRTGRSASVFWPLNSITSAARWGWPMKSSSTRTPALPI